MAVYTDLSDDDMRGFVARYDIGDLIAAEGIAQGVTNTNYRLTTATGPYILTLYEGRVSEADLPFFLGLMGHWNQHGIVCPQAIAGRDGGHLRKLAGKPAALFSFLTGLPADRPTGAQVAALGETVALAHLASRDFAMTRPNALGPTGWQELARKTADRADEIMPGLAAGIAAEISFVQNVWPRDLPKGAIHADLSPENVFFDGEIISGLIDFTYACTDFYAYELAILLNDWCFEEGGQFNVAKAKNLFAAYTAKRPLSAAEMAALPILARGASMPYMLTRLYDWFTRAGSLGTRKSPLDYWAKLKFHQGVKSAKDYGL